jgi:hypothetical protein
MKKQIKFYFHHEHFESIPAGKRSIFSIIGTGIVEICYGVGFFLIFVFALPWQILRAVNKAPHNLPLIKAKMRTKPFRRAMAAFVLLALLSTSAVQGLSLVATGLEVKEEVLGTSDVALGYLQQAKSDLEKQDAASASTNFAKALEQFQTIEQSLQTTHRTLNTILAVVPQKQDADKLLQAVQKITAAGLVGTEIIQLTDSMKLTAVGLSSGEQTRLQLQSLEQKLNEVLGLAEAAASLISDVSINSIPENYRIAFVAAKDTADLFLQNTQTLHEVSELAFELLLGQKNVLIVFQNNNEIRASGGFIGTVGSAKLIDGSLTKLDIRSVYDWDGQLQEKIMPPQPMVAVNNRWFLRDSNWFASFPESASRVGALFEKTGGETPELIIAMTPEVIIDMLERTGPITLDRYGVTLTAENFVEQTQTATSENYDRFLNQPKQMLADFYPQLMDRLGSSGGAMAFLEIFQYNLFKKNILLYSRNSELQKKINQFNWGGQLRSTERDYISIVNSNLGGTKTDRSVKRRVDLKSTVAQDGSIINTLTYTVTNPLPKSPSHANKSFVRIYVPSGAQLLESQGWSDLQIPRLSSEEYIQDEAVQKWQKSVSQNTITGTYTGQEAGKTWFGAWLETMGGETKIVTLRYLLPFKIGQLDSHSLLIQKQPGSLNTTIDYSLELGARRSLWKSSLTTLEGSALQYKQDLIADTFIGTVLQQL